MALGDVIARLSVSLDLNTTAFEKGSKRAQAQTETLGKKMTRIAGVIGTAFVASIGVDTVRSLVEMGKAAVDTVGALGEQAQQLGVTTDALQEFRFVASQTGIEQAEIDKALQRLTRTIGELAEPTKAQAKAMEQLGLSSDALKGLNADQALVVLSEAFNKLPDAATRSAVGFELMGRTFQTLLPLLNEGPERINAMVKAAHDLGIVLTPEQIANADKYADQIAALNASADAQKAAALAKYGDQLAELTKDYTQFQIDLVHAFIEIDKAGNGLTKTLQDFGKNTGIQDFFAAQNVSLKGIAAAFEGARVAIVRSVQALYTGVKTWVQDRLNGVFGWLGARIEWVAAKFKWLDDVVVRHSYIPDMVDAIGAHMARLGALMVSPAAKATEAVAQKFQDLRDLLDRLFPEVGTHNQFVADMARIEGSALNAVEKDAAWVRLQRELAGVDVVRGAGKTNPDFGSMGGPLVDGIGAASDAMDRLAERSRINTVRIAKSFKDMADDTLQSLSRLTSAIKGGGFLNILEAVIGFGLQLGSMGAFGKGVQANLNSVPKYATGTNFHRGGLALVGERGPELVSMPRGSRVTPNSAMGGVTNNYYTLPSDEFWGRINMGHAQAAQGGAVLAGAKLARSNKWSLA